MTRADALKALEDAARDMLDYSAHEPYCRWYRGGKCDCARRDLAEALAQLDSLPPDDGGWQPIETAPRDGTYVLIGWFEFSGQGSMHVAFWHSTLKAWCQPHQAFTSDPNWQPTHWRPLPPAPSPETKGRR